MNKLIYFNSNLARTLIDPSPAISHWFDVPVSNWPSFLQSRVNDISTPWPLAPSISKMPQANLCNTTFSDAFDSIAVSLLKKAEEENKTIYVSWSGGIDSTSVLVALLKHANSRVMKNIVVLHNKNSINENAYFYEKFILPNVSTASIVDFTATPENYKDILLLDGEAGNQVMGGDQILELLIDKKFDLIDSRFTDVSPTSIGFGNESAFNLVVESTKFAPCEITTVFDLLWWTNFNFKWNDVLLRKVPAYTEMLSAEQTKEFYYNSVYRFYEQPEVQCWSINSLNQRRIDCRVLTKRAAKDYIYDFDKNDLYFSNMREKYSVTKTHRDPVFAIDDNWNKLKLSNPEDRKILSVLMAGKTN